jgi:glycogen operon protein
MSMLIAHRLLRDLEAEYQSESLNQLLQKSNKAWHGVKLDQPDWSDWSHSFALTAESKKEKHVVHLILNAYWEPLDFELPSVSEDSGGSWRRWIDTSLDSPDDIVEWQKAPQFTGRSYRTGPRSIAVLYAPLGASS